jgi:hypothetical protein
MAPPGPGASGMPFSHVLRGRVAERILVTLLERGGFRVTRLGIEELFDEVKYLSMQEYLKLGLSKALRALPDLLVADAQISWAALVEVKYRRVFDAEAARELHATLTEQRMHCPEAYAAIIIAEPFVEGGRFHQDYIRMVEPGNTEALLWQPSPVAKSQRTERQNMQLTWERLPTILKLFRPAHFDSDTEEADRRGREFLAGCDYVTAAIKELRHF